MNVTLLYRDYSISVDYPPDDFTYNKAVKIVKEKIDDMLIGYNQNNITPPLNVKSSDGQVIWEGVYIHGSPDDDNKEKEKN